MAGLSPSWIRQCLHDIFVLIEVHLYITQKSLYTRHKEAWSSDDNAAFVEYKLGAEDAELSPASFVFTFASHLLIGYNSSCGVTVLKTIRMVSESQPAITFFWHTFSVAFNPIPVWGRGSESPRLYFSYRILMCSGFFRVQHLIQSYYAVLTKANVISDRWPFSWGHEFDNIFANNLWLRKRKNGVVWKAKFRFSSLVMGVESGGNGGSRRVKAEDVPPEIRIGMYQLQYIFSWHVQLKFCIS